jgi:hypothetical protein
VTRTVIQNTTPSLDARDAERGLLSRRLDAVVLLELFVGLAAHYGVEAAWQIGVRCGD